jgi:membrane protein implicated in regulation of membrane protease activity
MAPLGALGQMYAVSTGIGVLFMAYSLFMGRIGGGHGHGGGHAGVGHGAGHGGVSHGVGHGGVGHGVGHGVSHGPGHAGPAAGHGVGHAGGHAGGHGAGASHGAGHSTASGAAQNVDGSEAAAMAMQQFTTGQATALSRFHVPAHASSLVEIFLEFLNPMVLATFMTYFGLTGLIIHFAMPALGLISLAPAVIVGVIATRILLFVMHWMFAKMEVTSVAVVEELIGTFATVIVPITKGRVGQITYVVESKRFTAPAKPLDTVSEFKKGTKVMISEIRDNIMYIEPWTDSFNPTSS